MTIALSVGATTTTSQVFNFANVGASGVIELQIAPERLFQFCVCPIYAVPRAGSYTAPGLNQRTTYYARARTRTSDGKVEPWSEVVGFRTADGTARDASPANILIEPAMIVVPEPVTAFVDPLLETVSGFPMANMLRDAPVAWRGVTGTGSHHITFATAAPINTIALLNTNIPESASVIAYGGDTAASVAPGGAPAYQSQAFAFRASANLPGRPGYHGLFRLGALRSHRYWGLSIIDCATPGGMIHVEHLVAGRDRVTKNHSIDISETAQPLTTIERRRSGMVDRVRGLPMRKVDFDISLLTEAQYETQLADLWRRENEAVLVVPNSKAGAFLHDRMVFGDLSGGRTSRPSSARATRTITVNSII